MGKMTDRNPTSAILKPDYPKIVLVSIPLLFIIWALCFMTIAYLCHDFNNSLYGSILLTALFAAAYFYICIKRLDWFKTGAAEKIDTESSEENLSRKTLSTREGLFAIVYVIAAVCVCAYSQIVLQVPWQYGLLILNAAALIIASILMLK